MNQFGDLSKEEYKALLNFRPPTVHFETDSASAIPELPDSWDWRKVGGVTKVKNQGLCGSSPFFGAIVSVEGCHFITQGTLVSLSEQDINDCSVGINEGCMGGWMSASFQYIMDAKGVDTESCYPYKGEDGQCVHNPKPPCCGSTVGSYVNVTSGDEGALQAAVYQVPVAAAVDANTMQFYSSGIFSDPNCSSVNVYHGIAVVGWGNNGTTDYWILKNSFGTSWGEQGYILLERNANNMCGVATVASYALNCNDCAS
jgi:cathepsin L